MFNKLSSKGRNAAPAQTETPANTPQITPRSNTPRHVQKGTAEQAKRLSFSPMRGNLSAGVDTGSPLFKVILRECGDNWNDAAALVPQVEVLLHVLGIQVDDPRAGHLIGNTKVLQALLPGPALVLKTPGQVSKGCLKNPPTVQLITALLEDLQLEEKLPRLLRGCPGASTVGLALEILGDPQLAKKLHGMHPGAFGELLTRAGKVTAHPQLAQLHAAADAFLPGQTWIPAPSPGQGQAAPLPAQPQPQPVFVPTPEHVIAMRLAEANVVESPDGSYSFPGPGDFPASALMDALAQMQPQDKRAISVLSLLKQHLDSTPLDKEAANHLYLMLHGINKQIRGQGLAELQRHVDKTFAALGRSEAQRIAQGTCLFDADQASDLRAADAAETFDAYVADGALSTAVNFAYKMRSSVAAKRSMAFLAVQDKLAPLLGELADSGDFEALSMADELMARARSPYPWSLGQWRDATRDAMAHAIKAGDDEQAKAICQRTALYCSQFSSRPSEVMTLLIALHEALARAPADKRAHYQTLLQPIWDDVASNWSQKTNPVKFGEPLKTITDSFKQAFPSPQAAHLQPLWLRKCKRQNVVLNPHQVVGLLLCTLDGVDRFRLCTMAALEAPASLLPLFDDETRKQAAFGLLGFAPQGFGTYGVASLPLLILQVWPAHSDPIALARNPKCKAETMFQLMKLSPAIRDWAFSDPEIFLQSGWRLFDDLLDDFMSAIPPTPPTNSAEALARVAYFTAVAGVIANKVAHSHASYWSNAVYKTAAAPGVLAKLEMAMKHRQEARDKYIELTGAKVPKKGLVRDLVTWFDGTMHNLDKVNRLANDDMEHLKRILRTYKR